MTLISIKNEWESTFIEIVNPGKSNIIAGVIYRHPSMNLADFNCNYLTNYYKIPLKNKNLFSYLEILMLTSLIIMSIMRLMNF